jgi:hypothetical protein
MSLLLLAAEVPTAPPAPVTAWQTSGIVAGGALLAATLTVLGNFFLERFKRGVTDRRWLLDRRHEDAVHFLRRANTASRELRRLGSSQEMHDAVRTAEESYLAATITASQDVSDQLDLVYDGLKAMSKADSRDAVEAANKVFVERVRDAADVMREEVQPTRKRRLRPRSDPSSP